MVGIFPGKLSVGIHKEIPFVVPLVPPSVNHYVKSRAMVVGGKAFVSRYVTKEAAAFKEAVWVHCANRKLPKSKAYEVEYTVFLGKDQSGDVDNFGKLILDSLRYARVIHSDARVEDMIAHKRRDWSYPRTEIFVRALERSQC